MNSLPQIQSRFQAHILNGDDAVVGDVQGPDLEFRQARLRIYHDAYRLRLIEALSSDYETLKVFAGDGPFAEMVLGYIASRPSVVRNLRWFGGGFPDYLRTTPAYAQQGVLADLAHFEWTLGLAFDAADAATLRFDQVAAIPAPDWPRARFLAHPSVRIICPRWNVVAIWRALQDGAPVPEAVDTGPTAIAIWRKALSPHFRTLDAREAMFWARIHGGATFGQACESLAGQMAEADIAPLVASALRGWVDDGWLTEVSIAD